MQSLGHSIRQFAGSFAVLSAFSITSLGATAALAAPPGDLPFGAYDPAGYFEADPELSIEHVFLPWEDVDLNGLFLADDYALRRNRVLLVTIEPWTWDRTDRNEPARVLRNINEGSRDFNMRSICSTLNQLESPVTIRWAQEMDNETVQFIWANWTPEAYVAAFQRVTDVCREVAPNVQIMWSPLGDNDVTDYYPGDDYVDIVGISVFGLEPWEEEVLGAPRSFLDVVTPKYENASVFGKPVVIAELGYVGSEAYVNAWENAVRIIYPQFPALVAAVYFNQREVYPWPDDFGMPSWYVEDRIIN